MYAPISLGKRGSMEDCMRNRAEGGGQGNKWDEQNDGAERR
jgi:hypothetical protein